MTNEGIKLFIRLSAALSLFAWGALSLTAADTSSLSNPEGSAVVGDALFHDKTLSNPPGQACVSCHDPETGFTYPDSAVNNQLGTVPRAVPGRFGKRKPP